MPIHMDSKKPQQSPEPTAVRIFQGFILLTGLGFLFWFFLPLPWPLLLLGALVLISAIPPINGKVNTWVTGSPKHMHLTVARIWMGGLMLIINGIKLLI